VSVVYARLGPFVTLSDRVRKRDVRAPTQLAYHANLGRWSPLQAACSGQTAGDRISQAPASSRTASLTDRPRRSSFHTTRVSPRRRYSRAAASPGRAALRLEISSPLSPLQDVGLRPPVGADRPSD
jgi:hypothetical protein